MEKEHIIIKLRWVIIVGCILLAIIMGLQLFKIEIDPDPLSLLPADMKSRKNTSYIESIFGSSDMLFVIIESKDILDQNTLLKIKKLSNDLNKISGVKKITSIFDTRSIDNEEDAMVVNPAIPTIPSTEDEKEDLRKKLSKNEMVMDFVLSKDFRYSAIMIELEVSASTKKVLDKTIEIINKYQGPEKIHIAGQPAFENIITQQIGRDISILIPIAVVIIISIFYGFYRSIRAIVLPLGVVVLSTLFGLGILPLMHWKITILTAILPLMVIGFTNNYGIYLVSKYLEYTKNNDINLTSSQIAIKIFKEFSMPILFSALTTVAGVLGLLTHIMVPAKHIGIAAALAICYSLIATLGGIIAVFSLLKKRSTDKKFSTTSFPFLEKLLSFIADIINSHPVSILAGGIVVLLLSIYSALYIKVDANQENLFDKNHPIRISTDIINKNFGGSHSMLIMFEGDIKNPTLLKEMKEIKDGLLKLPGVSQVNSIADVVITLSKAINEKNSPEYNTIPSTREAVAQYLELYSMSGGDPSDFEKLIDFNYTKALMIIRINNGATETISTIENHIKNLAENNPHIKTIGGYATIFNELAFTLIKGQITSILFAFIFIIILVMIQFRSVAAGLLAAIPLFFSITIGFGIMSLSGIRIDYATAMIFSIVIGCGVDFFIQFLWKYKSLHEDNLPSTEAIKKSLLTIGPPIIFNAICIASGFFALFLSRLPPLRHFALIFGILTTMCMISSLIIVPAICLKYNFKFLKPKKGVK